MSLGQPGAMLVEASWTAKSSADNVWVQTWPEKNSSEQQAQKEAAVWANLRATEWHPLGAPYNS